MKYLKLSFVLGIVGAFLSSAQGVVIQSASDSIVIRASEADSITDPDGDFAVWESIVDENAFNGSSLIANRTGANATDESIASYQIEFATAGTYRLYFRAQWDDSGSDSFYLPTAFDTDPDQTGLAGNNPAHDDPVGQYNWYWNRLSNGASGDVYQGLFGSGENGLIVTTGDLGNRLELRLGVREPNLRLDTLILSLDNGLTGTQLDALAINATVPEANSLYYLIAIGGLALIIHRRRQ